MLKLIIEDDEGKTTVVPLIRDEISIGRKEGNTIRLTERNISRRHARLLRRNGNVFLEDLSSYNGIRVNGSRIQGQIGVAEGDRIQIGDYMLALKQDQPAAAAPADPFDEMKTVPVEKAEAQALAAHLAQQQAVPASGLTASSQTPPVPAVAASAQAVEPAPPAPRQRDLIDEAAKAASTTPPAKMVVVSSNFAGLECRLDKAAQVIGRTDDNDIVIDHRSVSKHHAKIVVEGGAYLVVDQGSSNGIFVNGEKYDRIELRSGDIVDLGHVRMRFVAPDDPWVFDPATAVETGPEGKKSNLGLIAVVGSVLVGAIVVAVLFGTGVLGGGKKKSDAGSGSADAAMTAPMDPDRPAARPGDYKAVRDALAARDWKTAIREADSLLLANSDDPEAKKLRQKSLEEQKNEQHSTAFFSALQSGQWEKAVFDGSQVASDSVYSADVSKRLVEVKKKYQQQLVTEAKRLHQARDCAALGELTNKLQTLDPADTTIRELGRSCRPKEELVAVGPMDPPRVPPMDAPPPMDCVRPEPMRPVVVEPMDRPVVMEPDTGPSADELLQQAQAASLSSQYGRAMMLAQQSIRKKPSARAWAVYGAAACNSSNKGGAKRAFRSLSGGMRGMLVTLCKNKGIALPLPRPPPVLDRHLPHPPRFG